ncbi:MAG: hypothetical protein H8E13_21770 [Actinobacteria bacterium]|nr:hypothetical protein [Actinomycetota bacterium]
MNKDNKIYYLLKNNSLYNKLTNVELEDYYGGFNLLEKGSYIPVPPSKLFLEDSENDIL